jgi:flagellar biosynthetic protein FlhB
VLGGGFVLVTLTLVVQLASTGFGFSGKNLFPRFDRFQLLGKLSRLPAENAFSTVKAIIILPVFGFLLYQEISGRIEEIANFSVMDLAHGIPAILTMIRALLIRMTEVLVVLAVVDFVRQRRKHRRQLRMSKQEIRDEMKEIEGNPQMKARIRQIQRERARRHMMKAVKKASVVVVNPTHYAVALYYELNTRTVPTVLAKGQNYLAQKIKDEALAHNIPIIENVVLAQALYKSTEIGQEIPPHLYRAVAEVLAYIYRTLNRDAPGPKPS